MERNSFLFRGQKIPATRNGTHCLWHAEKSASLVFAETPKPYYHCYGCCQNGWKYHFILRSDAARVQLTAADAPSAFSDRFSDTDQNGLFVWQTGDEQFVAARERLTHLIEAIRATEPIPHVDLGYNPRGHVRRKTHPSDRQRRPPY